MKSSKNELKHSPKGITLISLVVTIIVLLILASASIALLVSDNGIISQAIKAKEQTEIGDEKEKISLSVAGALLKNNGGELKRNFLNEELTNYIGTENTDYTLSESTPFIVKYLDSGRSYQIDENGNVSEYVPIDISEYVKIGDYVDYTPDDKADNVYYDKFGEIYSGYSNGNIGQDDTLKWRILNINSDGTIDLISDKPTSAEVHFEGARGYNNGVYLLNDYCKTMYSNSLIGAVARSLNIEDIQSKMIVNNDTGKKAYEDYISSTGIKYEDTNSYSIDKWYPLQWKNDNGTIGESKQETLISYASEKNAKSEETEGNLIVTQTFWKIMDESEVQSNFISGNTRNLEKADTIYYELLCNNGDYNYWLASRFADNYNESYPSFGLRVINYGRITGQYTYYSWDFTHGNSFSIRPIITIKSNIIDTNTDYETEGHWNLK